MDRKSWILLKKETKRNFSEATWVPLRASQRELEGDARTIPYKEEYFGCGSAAFPPEHTERASTFGWHDIGPGRGVLPYAYEDGNYSPVEVYQYNDNDPLGVNLVFDHPQPVIGGRRWLINPDLIIALRLVKEGNNWVRPEEDFTPVIREHFDDSGNHTCIEIRRDHLLDYLAARNLNLRLAYYRQRVENVSELHNSSYAGLSTLKEHRDGANFELLVRNLEDVFGGSWASIRAWRTDIDEEEDAPSMGPETNENTEFESHTGHRSGYPGTRVEGEFWKEEWINHKSQSLRVRGDKNPHLPTYIVETDGSRMSSHQLDDEDIGRWLWFRSEVVNTLLSHRGFSMNWYTRETGGINSPSGHSTHFGLNSADLVTVYAYDVAKLPAWEQQIWSAHNVAPDGKVSAELLAAQVRTAPASTTAPEDLLIQVMELLEDGFKKHFNTSLFSHPLKIDEAKQQILRFRSTDRASLLRLAKDLIRSFSDRIDVSALRKISTNKNKDQLKANKLLQDILATKVGEEEARKVLGPIFGTYDLRVGDAHPTGSGVEDALKLVDIDPNDSPLRQGQALIHNFGYAIWLIGRGLFKPQ
ncbi:hypothetical protein ABM187_003509 [Stenotrophomonas maltophilia]